MQNVTISNMIGFISIMAGLVFTLFIAGLIFIKIKYSPENYFFVKPFALGLIKIFLLFLIGAIIYFIVVRI